MTVNGAGYCSTITTAGFAELLRLGEGMGRRLGLSWDLTVDAVTEVALRSLGWPEQRRGPGYMAVCIWHQLLRCRQGADGLPRLPGAQRRRKRQGAA